ncbi:MAG: calcineurin [Myxococcales bacterium FL481]|nr:MAG: calcineurin [Myxococcales bacterium FL481]
MVGSGTQLAATQPTLAAPAPTPSRPSPAGAPANAVPAVAPHAAVLAATPRPAAQAAVVPTGQLAPPAPIGAEPTAAAVAAATPVAAAAPASAAAPAAEPATTGLPPLGPDARTRIPAPSRVVAFGDLHGDITALRSALLAGGLIDLHGRWVGGNTVVVQTGDQIDRGDADREVLDLLEYVDAFAREAGGALYALNGNHEVMNARGYMRYVTRAGFSGFRDVPGIDIQDEALADVSSRKRARVAAFRPGGPYARMLARRNVIMIVGDSVFVHGGILPQYATIADELNKQTRAWLRGQLAEAPSALLAADGPLWSRDFSEGAVNCELLAHTLARMSVARMVVGHTTQDAGINAACDGRVWRLDVGMSEHYGGPVQVLEIANGNVRVLRGERWTGATG